VVKKRMLAGRMYKSGQELIGTIGQREFGFGKGVRLSTVWTVLRWRHNW
jgi:hypothetical protein